MIVRLMGEGQYRLDDGTVDELNELDEQAVAAIESGDEQTLARMLGQMADRVRERGDKLPDDDLSTSELIIPPPDLSLDEARELFSGDGLIPDLPTR
jgi:hypothetical protein